MMSSIPPAAANDVATLLQVIADPKGAQKRLDAIKAAHDELETRAKKLGDYETQLSAREAALAQREEAAKQRDLRLQRINDEVHDAKIAFEAEKAAFDAANAKELAAQEVTRLNVNRDAGVNKAAASKLAAQRDEMASQESGLHAMRAGLEEREKAVQEAEAALAAKQDRLAKALQS